MANAKPNLDRLAKRPFAPPTPPKSHAEQLETSIRLLLYAFDPVAFCKEVLSFTPDAWQERLLCTSSRKIIVNIARQQGKSTTAAAKAVHRAVCFPKSVILIVGPAVPQASELRRKIDDHLRVAKIKFETKADNKRELEFSNGSRIILLAADEDTVRSYTADMIIEDEAASVPDEVYEAMEPMLFVRDGQHILLGTPKGKRGHFSDIWHAGSKDWDRYRITAWENTRIPGNRARLEALREEKRRLGRLWWFEQEYECSFVAAAHGLCYPFDEKINVGLHGLLALARAKRFGWQFVLGIDYGFTDSVAMVVLGWQPHDPVVYVIESFEQRGLTPSQAADVAKSFVARYPFARIVGDTGGLGKGYVEEARRRFRLPIEPAEKNNKRGYIELMSGELKAGLIKVLPGNDGLIDEWKSLPWDEEREMPADGFKDHLADACLYAWRATYGYLEEVRKAGPAPGSPEALKAEADEMFERRLKDVTKEGSEWWDVEEEPAWMVTDTSREFLN
jgi:hypothetical protein